ncbi:H-2 class II histocompatibility antigen, E-S beta chain isoform X1 [Microcaecilia unicolor]|uniref:H-2 class II histocompatibility antigen, E-S beta chain-like isoform X1 n=1 Tax=Microcaecilia unicolor TaxID=1415580 RepID=A0A6P7WVL7_9AMPH|nr:H-2 class II histocompatibility antigen, E-S beta chain-like isoform X1 [Microcaecilia unicolor]
MVSIRAPGAGGCSLGVLIMILTVLRTHLTHCGNPPAVFLHQAKAECHFRAGGQGMRYLERHFINREEYAYFDSDIGHFVGRTELGVAQADYWNNDTAYMELTRAAVETFCRHNYETHKPFTEQRRVPPKVKITPTRSPSLEHQNLLVCMVSGFFPSEIQVKWLRNGVEESRVVYAQLLQNGDWTYQVDAILETVLEHRDTYTCEVEHSSLQQPLRVNWEPETSESARSKLLTGIMGFVLGVVFIIVGLIIYLKNKKGRTELRIPPNEGLLS